MSETRDLARRRGRRRSETEREDLVRARVFEAALGLVRRGGPAELTGPNLAEMLHIRTNSLFKLIGDIEQLRGMVTVQAIKELTEFASAAVEGRQGREALEALIDAQRLFAQAQPGMYAASESALNRTCFEAYPVVDALSAVELAVIKTYGAPSQRWAELAWCLRASIRGAISLEITDKLTRSDEVDQRFDQLIEFLDAGAKLAAARGSARSSTA